MAAELRESLGVEAELVSGRGGVFKIEADGLRVFTKREVGRFPLPGEVPGLLAEG